MWLLHFGEQSVKKKAVKLAVKARKANPREKWLRRIEVIGKRFNMSEEDVWQEFVCGALCWERIASFNTAELYMNNANDLLMRDLFTGHLVDVPEAVEWMADKFDEVEVHFQIDGPLMAAFLRRVAKAIPHEGFRSQGGTRPEDAAKLWPECDAA
jgi:hypothetical protein